MDATVYFIFIRMAIEFNFRGSPNLNPKTSVSWIKENTE